MSYARPLRQSLEIAQDSAFRIGGGQVSRNPVAFDGDLATAFRAAQAVGPCHAIFRCVIARLRNAEGGHIDGGRSVSMLRRAFSSSSAAYRNEKLTLS
jgi:hypothetical protein